jgi:hypothetical protein
MIGRNKEVATKSAKVAMCSVGAVLLIWVISAVAGAIYLMAPADSSPNFASAGQTIALIFFAVTTTAIWLGVLVAVLVIAWKWFRGVEAPPAASSRS